MAAPRVRHAAPPRSSGLGTAGVLLAAITIARLAYSPCMRRLFRNAALPGIPERIEPKYASCTDEDLVQAVSLVVTVKDTCGQAGDLLAHLANMFPRNMHVFYAYPNIRGCRHVPVEEIGRRFFSNFTVLSVGASDAPIAGFLKVQPLLKTKYAVLSHNDAYPLEREFACEMFRALEANPQYPIAAPQIYETASDGVIVPHGHHQNLHVRPGAGGKGTRIDYDLSLHLLTQRKPDDFQEGPQVDFLEDHAFFARSDRYHELLDPAGSFTLEYMDMILNMRARNTSAWYVPTARCVFEVDTKKITWEDLPYLVYKRSEQIGHQVRAYLTNKWGVEFANTGIWNYVRYVMLSEVVLEGHSLPHTWADQASVFWSWFESVGFNRYDGKYLPDFVEDPSPKVVNVSRTMRQELDTSVAPDRKPPQSAKNILPWQPRKKVGAIDIAFKEPHIPIGVRVRNCDATDPDSYRLCGLAVQDGDGCTCYTYVAPFNLRTTFWLDKVMAALKLPARAFMYGQMKYWPVPIDPQSVDIYCEQTQEECEFQLQFSSKARILQWSWFGKQTKYPVTLEGFSIAATISLAVLLPLLLTPSRLNRWVGVKSKQIRSLAALHAMVGDHAIRS